MSTASEQLLEQIITSLREMSSVTSAWLAGSHGRGTNDEFSDIDIWVAVDDGAMPEIVQNPLSFVHRITPTILHMAAPEIAPEGGAFVGTWVPVADGFVQVDWYIARASNATRERETRVFFGDVPVRSSEHLAELSPPDTVATISENLTLTLQMISNMVKHAKRGNLWRANQHAQYADRCLINAKTHQQHGVEPDFASLQNTYLRFPPPTSAAEVQNLALELLGEVRSLGNIADAGLEGAIAALSNQVTKWRDSGWKPTEEYYRTLPRRYVGAGLLITDPEGNILLVETTYKDVFEIPGGVTETGESPRETAKREAREELGIAVEPGKLLVVDSRFQPLPKGDALMFVYDGGFLADSTILQPDAAEIRQVHFVAPDAIDAVVSPQMAIRLRAALNSRAQNRVIEITDGVLQN